MTSRAWAVGTALAALSALRLCHVGVVWVEEAYPMAAARAMLAGRALYRDVWFDKPPLFPAFYALFGAVPGWPLRIAGVAFVLFAAWAAARAARQIFAHVDGVGAWAAVLTAFFFTCDFAATAMALTPDLLAVPFHLLAIGAAAACAPFTAGVFCGIALGFNSKALLFALVALMWIAMRARWRTLASNVARFGAGFAVPVALMVAWLYAQGALADHWREVWVWGAAYSRDSLFTHPVREGVVRTLAWAGFHIALVVATVLALGSVKSRSGGSGAVQGDRPTWQRVLPFAVWIAVSLGGAWLGWRFFPRYFFHLLPTLLMPAAAGFALAGKRWRMVLLACLALPLVRFAPASLQLGLESLRGAPHASRDLALFNDAQRASALVKPLLRPNDTALVWGYRPELYALTGMLPGTRYLDSQPLNGVLADRHLTSSQPTLATWARPNREALYKTAPPEWIFDGLGPVNPQLTVFDEATGLAQWRERYTLIATTKTFALYHVKTGN